MPNWITNILCLSGNSDDINLIVGTEFSFANLIPVPKEGVDRDWFLENWGTKWNASNIKIIKPKKNKIIIRFNTPWGPPNKWLEFIYDNMPNVNFKLVYADEDFPTSGYIKIKNDKIEKETYDINKNKAMAFKFTKKYFPDIYTCGMKALKKHEKIKKINKKLNEEFNYLKKEIKMFQGVEIY
jgi:hypothetical protein